MSVMDINYTMETTGKYIKAQLMQTSKVKIPSKEFIFSDILKSIVEKYNQYARGIFREKNK